MNIKRFFKNCFKDQYVIGFVQNGRQKICDAYYKKINSIKYIIIYLFGLFSQEIKDFLISFLNNI